MSAVAKVLILNGAETERLLGDGSGLIAPLEQALVGYSQGAASAPPRVAAVCPRGLLAAMPAYVPGAGLATKLVSIFPSNRNLPSHQGVVALFDHEDGRLLCLMDGRWVTARRTAAVSAISVARLRRSGARVLAILGSGEQARAHLDLIGGPFEEVRVAARSQDGARRLARSAPGCTVSASFQEAVLGADVIIACTAAAEPVVNFGWLSPGAHVVSVGTGRELEEEILRRGRLFVEWKGAGSQAPPAGAVELQGIELELLTELGELIQGTRPGREADSQITVFKSTGLGVEDAAVAADVYRSAVGRGVGTTLDW